MKDDSIIINYEKAILDSLLANNEKFYINSYNNQKEKINLHKKKDITFLNEIDLLELIKECSHIETLLDMLEL